MTQSVSRRGCSFTYLQFDLGFRNVLLAPGAGSYLLRFGDLGFDRLQFHQTVGFFFFLLSFVVSVRELACRITYVRAKVLNWESLDCIDAQGRVGLNDGESAGNYTRRPRSVNKHRKRNVIPLFFVRYMRLGGGVRTYGRTSSSAQPPRKFR